MARKNNKPYEYESWLNTKDKDNDEQFANIRESLRRGRPFGEESWVAHMVDRNLIWNQQCEIMDDQEKVPDTVADYCLLTTSSKCKDCAVPSQAIHTSGCIGMCRALLVTASTRGCELVQLALLTREC